MIVAYLSLLERIKLLLGWNVCIELWPNTAQSYQQYLAAPWEDPRKLSAGVPNHRSKETQ